MKRYPVCEHCGQPITDPECFCYDGRNVWGSCLHRDCMAEVLKRIPVYNLREAIEDTLISRISTPSEEKEADWDAMRDYMEWLKGE